jgi:AraC-like DNA-binding protein
MNEAFSFLYLLAFALGLVAAAVLVFRQRNRSTINSTDSFNGISVLRVPGGASAEKMLSFILLILALQSLNTFLYSKNVLYGSSLYLGLGVFGNLIVWPLFYLYVGFGTSGNTKIKKIHLLHFLIPILMLLPIVRLASMAQKDPFFINSFNLLELKNREIPGEMFRDRINRPPMEKEEEWISRRRLFENRAKNPFMIPPPLRIPFLEQAFLYQVDIYLLVHHGMPPVLSTSIPETVLGRMPWGRELGNVPGKGILSQISFIGGGILIYGWIYIIFIMIGVIKYSKKIRDRSTSIERRNMTWLTVLFTVIGSVQTMMTFLFVFSSTFERPFIIFRLSNSLPLPLLYIVTICGYVIFTRNRRVDENKYGRNVLSPGELEHYFRILIKYMKEKMPYREESLTLNQVAEDLNIHANNLSQVINKKEGCNFRDFINSFRVEEVKKRLLKPESKDKNILSIAYESGFNSKSAFNLIFKKHTHMTPSEYVKKYKK